MHPEKETAKGSDLSIAVYKLQPYDWLVTDLMSVQDREQKSNADYMVVCDRSSRFVFWVL